jgi:oxalate decarboxylase/phosphoglucose isomerase-like protein (cupin superfamily)
MVSALQLLEKFIEKKRMQVGVEFTVPKGRAIAYSLFKNEFAGVVVVHMDAGTEFPLHYHLGEETIVCTQGNFDIFIQSPGGEWETVKLKPGDKCFIPREYPHYALIYEHSVCVALLTNPGNDYPDV